MKKSLWSYLVVLGAVLSMLTLVTACSDDDDPPAGHSLVLGGVSHADPASVACDGPDCHGPDSTGGEGPACSLCHME